uniref:Uncharacterized protein n=1 Tax=viral metagenome TaxID=1070528 RepID=A0A6C0EEC2_9ZZZZ
MKFLYRYIYNLYKKKVYSYYYLIKDQKKDEEYRTIFNKIGCVEGNRESLLDKVEKNNSFCRNQEGISYDYFLHFFSFKTPIL